MNIKDFMVFHTLLIEQPSNVDISDHFEFDVYEKKVRTIVAHFDEFEFDGLFFPASVSGLAICGPKSADLYEAKSANDKWNTIKKSTSSSNNAIKIKRYVLSLLSLIEFKSRQFKESFGKV